MHKATGYVFYAASGNCDTSAPNSVVGAAAEKTDSSFSDIESGKY